MKYRFVEALNSFLNDMGRSDLINPQLDCHSNIQLEMNDAPAINIDLSSDDVIIWCHLAEYSAARFDSVSQNLLNIVLVKSKWTLLIDNFHTQQGSHPR
ncbi:hypothetical protein [Providencia sp. PROV080]|uniref:InvB/SpaK family type III secretion system chaperone n=1 Tax=Providencia sp. PROV080 TaxID=2936780 RepID=UPI00298F7A20|nr:hypothetical protein [Providencia sp. PROV080]